MGFFDSIGNGISSLFGNTDPLRAAQIRGGMLGAAQALMQPYGNIGSALVGAGQGYQGAKEQYLGDQFQGLRNQVLQQQVAQSAARRAAINNYLLGKPTASPADTMTGAQTGGALPAPQTQAGPIVQPPPTAATQERKIPNFSSLQEATDFYNLRGEDAFLERAFPNHKLTGYAPGTQVRDETGQEVFTVPEKPIVPTTRTFRKGTQEVTEQWNPKTNSWDQIAAGVAFKPDDVPINNDPVSRQATAAQIATGQPLNQVIPGFGKAAVGQRQQARQDAIALIMQQNPGMTATNAGTELANRTIEFQSGKKSSGQLTQMLGATKQAVAQLDFNVKRATEEMAKLPSSDLSPLINAIARGEQKWTGNPAYSTLFYFMHASAVESARLLAGGQASVAQLQQGAMEEAKKWANENLTPSSWNAVGKAMEEEGAYRIQTYQDALKSQRIGNAAPDANTSRTPTPDAIRDLKMRGKGASAQFDEIFGPGAAAKVLGK